MSSRFFSSVNAHTLHTVIAIVGDNQICAPNGIIMALVNCCLCIENHALERINWSFSFFFSKCDLVPFITLLFMCILCLSNNL